MTVAYDPRSRAIKQFDEIVGVPTTFIFDADGVERFRHCGYNEKIGNKIIAKLNQLLGISFKDSASDT